MVQSLEVDVGTEVPFSYAGLRRILRAIGDVSPKTIESAARERPAVWNVLFPGSVQGPPDLTDVALSPSERRLHRESEQVFWILNVSARAILDGLRASGRELVLRSAGAADLVSLRALMRAVEWGRLEPDAPAIHFTGWQVANRQAQMFSSRRQELLDSLRARLREGPGPLDDRPIAPGGKGEALVDLEARYISAALNSSASPEHRLAASILAIRNAFFTTNYEIAMLAAEQGLQLLDRLGVGLDVQAVQRAWDELDTGLATAAIEIDRSSLGTAAELRALLWRCVGVVRSFVGDNDAAMAAFGEGLSCDIPPESRGHLHMFRALSLIKRMGRLSEARHEAETGIAFVAGRGTDESALQEAWLRNVLALIWFQEKKLDSATREEMRAIECLSNLHTASATHLKINLITNLSSIQESAGRFHDAITSWRKFERMIDRWNNNFYKHHRYRLAGLQRLAGAASDAERYYTEAYENALKLEDAFHCQVIAADLAQHFRARGDRATAEHWYERALADARSIGDPLRVAEQLAGIELSRGTHDFAKAIQFASHSSTFAREGERLISAMRGGDPSAVSAALPKIRTKLNRPFDIVNLY